MGKPRNTRASILIHHSLPPPVADRWWFPPPRHPLPLPPAPHGVPPSTPPPRPSPSLPLPRHHLKGCAECHCRGGEAASEPAGHVLREGRIVTCALVAAAAQPTRDGASPPASCGSTHSTPLVPHIPPSLCCQRTRGRSHRFFGSRHSGRGGRTAVV